VGERKAVGEDDKPRETQNMDDTEVVEILLAIEKIVQGSEFSAWQRNFIDAHVDKFDFGEENKVCTSPSVS
jgi:hypothetical protein